MSIGDLKVTPAAIVTFDCEYSCKDDGIVMRDVPVSCARLENSVILSELDSYLSYLSEAEKHDVSDILGDHLDLFSDIPNRTAVMQHDIDVGDSRPIKQHAYRVNPYKRRLMQGEVDYLLQHGLAIPSISPWSSPCLLVPKPDGTSRFCTDFRRANSVTKTDSYPLPRMDDCVDRIGGARFVTKLDLLKRYWQVPLTARASEVSAFVTPDNFLQYTVLAFGLKNAPATFQGLMNCWCW